MKMKLLFLAAWCVAAAAVSGGELKPVKYVFFFVGDGMGSAQRMLPEYVYGKSLLINELPVVGMTTTTCADRTITDSAAAGTAFACGVKTNAGMIGVTPDGRPVESVAEYAKKNGRKVGILTSVSIDHATPAAFYAHVGSRGSYYDIARQLLESNFDYFGGGGFVKPDGPQGNIAVLARKAGYRVLNSDAELRKLSAAELPVIAIAPRLDKDQALPYAIDAVAGDWSLADFTRQAIALLDQPDGFFMMVEGGKIDWASHANDAATVAAEVKAFDEAVQVACDFAALHPEETLIVVTADHETGGLTLGYAGTGYGSHYPALTKQKLSFEAFTAKFRREAGDPENAAAADFGLEALTPAETGALSAAVAAAPKGDALLYGTYHPVAVALTRLTAHRAGADWTTWAHTAVPVITTAVGVGAEAFAGRHDNTDQARLLKQAVGRLR